MSKFEILTNDDKAVINLGFEESTIKFDANEKITYISLYSREKGEVVSFTRVLNEKTLYDKFELKGYNPEDVAELLLHLVKTYKPEKLEIDSAGSGFQIESHVKRMLKDYNEIIFSSRNTLSYLSGE